jgi:uncharacterized protein (DUF2249 family)
MTGAAGGEHTDSAFEGRPARRASLKEEHALLMREVRARAQAVISDADEGRWPQAPLRELLNYLHLETLRQLVEEEWLLFRVVRHVPDVVARLRRDHLELRLTIELLDQAAATAGSAAGLSCGQLSAITTDLLDQLEKHLSDEDELAIGGEYAPGTATFGAQPHEWYALIEGPEVDLDQLPGAQGADAVLARIMRLDTDETVTIGSSSDLGSLCQRLTAVDPGGYGITYLERGPDRWQVEITRRPASTRSRP